MIHEFQEATRPEAALVKALAAGRADEVSRAFHARPDWEKVGDLAASHQVEALCWWMWNNVVVRDLAKESLELPSLLHDRMKMAYLHHRLRNEVLANDLAVLQEALAARGIEALCFKGPWMAFRAYPEPGTRPVGDIDLCVREESYGGAVAALEAGGWRPHGGLPRTSREALAESHYRRQLRFSAPGRRPVELHFRLVNMGPPGPEEQWLWESARDLRVGSCSLKVPGPEAMLLHLLIHANQHGFTVLRLLHDIRWALCHEDSRDLDTAVFHRLVGQLRCRATCYHALKLATDLAGAEVDDRVLEALRPSAPRRRVFAFVWRLDAVRRLEAVPPRMETAAPLFYLCEMGRWRDKALFIARVIITAGGPLGLLHEARRLFSKDPTERIVKQAIELPKRPSLRDGLVFRQLDEDTVVYSPATDRTALLNPSAVAVLDLCDGSRTAGEIADEVAALFAEEERGILAYVETTLNALMGQGFLEPAEAQRRPRG